MIADVIPMSVRLSDLFKISVKLVDSWPIGVSGGQWSVSLYPTLSHMGLHGLQGTSDVQY